MPMAWSPRKCPFPFPEQSHSVVKKAFTDYEALLSTGTEPHIFALLSVTYSLDECSHDMDDLIPSLSLPLLFAEAWKIPTCVDISHRLLFLRQDRPDIKYFGVWGILHKTEAFDPKEKLREPSMWIQWGQVTVIGEVRALTSHSVKHVWGLWGVKDPSCLHSCGILQCPSGKFRSFGFDPSAGTC